LNRIEELIEEKFDRQAKKKSATKHQKLDENLGEIDLDKSWEVIQLCFNNGELAGGKTAAGQIMLGGDREWLRAKASIYAAIKLPKLVKTIHQSLESVTEAKFKKLFRALTDTDIADQLQLDEDSLDYHWGHFCNARELYSYAAANDLAVVFSMSG
jgi:hypothetical protein